MSVPDGPTLPLKVMINKQKSKVLFAEANSDIADVLLSFLTLPLGNIVRILDKHYGSEAPVIGSLTSLYRGLSNLDSSHFCVSGAKQMLLNPISSFQVECRRLKLDISDQPRKVYYCQDSKCPNSKANNASLYSGIAKCVCGKPLNQEEFVKERADDANVGVFMTKSASHIICDDLRVVAVDSGFLQTLNYLGITDEMSILSIDGIDDIMCLFKNSLVSATPLTDLVNKKTQKSSTTSSKLEAVGFLHDIHNGDANSRKMSLKILLQKSTNKFLLAVASDEFVEFLFSLLAIPLGGVEYLLGGNTCLKNIDNLYKSVTDVIDNKYFMSPVKIVNCIFINLASVSAQGSSH